MAPPVRKKRAKSREQDKSENTPAKKAKSESSSSPASDDAGGGGVTTRSKKKQKLDTPAPRGRPRKQKPPVAVATSSPPGQPSVPPPSTPTPTKRPPVPITATQTPVRPSVSPLTAVTPATPAEPPTSTSLAVAPKLAKSQSPSHDPPPPPNVPSGTSKAAKAPDAGQTSKTSATSRSRSSSPPSPKSPPPAVATIEDAERALLGQDATDSDGASTVSEDPPPQSRPLHLGIMVPNSSPPEPSPSQSAQVEPSWMNPVSIARNYTPPLMVDWQNPLRSLASRPEMHETTRKVLASTTDHEIAGLTAKEIYSVAEYAKDLHSRLEATRHELNNRETDIAEVEGRVLIMRVEASDNERITSMVEEQLADIQDELDSERERRQDLEREVSTLSTNLRLAGMRCKQVYRQEMTWRSFHIRHSVFEGITMAMKTGSLNQGWTYEIDCASIGIAAKALKLRSSEHLAGMRLMVFTKKRFAAVFGKLPEREASGYKYFLSGDTTFQYQTTMHRNFLKCWGEFDIVKTNALIEEGMYAMSDFERALAAAGYE